MTWASRYEAMVRASVGGVLPRPPLPEQEADCEAYHEALCRYGTDLRALGPGAAVPECEAAVLDRCRALVAAAAAGRASAAQAQQAARYIDWSPEDLARNVELGRFTGEERAALEATVPAVAAHAAAVRRFALVRAVALAGAVTITVGGILWWRRRRRRTAAAP